MSALSVLEKGIFLLLTLSALLAFFFPAKKIVSIIKQGKPEPDRLNNIGRRILRVITEVFLQKRVIGGRPAAGLLHFGVFIAFAAFTLETSHMFLEPFGLGFLPAVFGDALTYFRMFMLTVSSIAALCITGLAIRRFVFTKYSPDPKSVESGIVALFILLLMLTYIDLHGTYLVYPKIDWWVHVIIILVFPLIIIRSKHLHLFLAPVSVFLRKSRLWEVEKMNLDMESVESEDDISLGLETVADIPWKLRLDFFACVQCRRCTDSCPAAQAGMELRPADFVIAGRKTLLAGNSGAPVIGTIISETALGQCTSCMACENVCPVGVEHSQLLAGAKAAQTLAIGTGGVATEFLKNMNTYSTPFAVNSDVRNALIDELKIPVYEKGAADYVLWLGCVWSYNPDYKKIVSATVTSLQNAGISFGVLKNEKCSGHHSRKQGEEMQFQELAEENAQTFRDENVRRIITGCPHCYHTLKNEYTDYLHGHAIEIKHHSQVFAEKIASGDLKLKRNALNGDPVTYHDPCYLGRFEGIVQKPRFLIDSVGGKIVEMQKNRKTSYCCGGGAAGFTIEHKDGKRVDQERKKQVHETGVSRLITACPECKLMLSGAVESTHDISEIIADSLKEE